MRVRGNQARKQKASHQSIASPRNDQRHQAHQLEPMARGRSATSRADRLHGEELQSTILAEQVRLARGILLRPDYAGKKGGTTVPWNRPAESTTSLRGIAWRKSCLVQVMCGNRRVEDAGASFMRTYSHASPHFL